MGAPLDWTINLLPSSNLSTLPGGTVQWNYQLTNLSNTDTLVLNNLNAGVFQYGTPMSLFDFPIVAPLASATGVLYQFILDSNAPVGFVNSGTFVLSADFYMGDPTHNGIYDTPAPDKTADYSVTVSDATVPEPGTLALSVTMLPMLGWRLRGSLRKWFGRSRLKTSSRSWYSGKVLNCGT